MLPYIQAPKPAERLVIKGSVALVGNSDALAGKHKGKEIDSHDTVFRFNLARVGPSYVDAVGKKVSYFLFSRMVTLKTIDDDLEFKWFKQICSKVRVICYPEYAEKVMPYQPNPFFLMTDIADCNHVFNKLLGHNKHEFPKVNHPRNGIKLLACLVSAGVVPSLFGFDTEEREDNNHYFDDETQIESEHVGHKPSIEYGLLKELDERGFIRLVK